MTPEKRPLSDRDNLGDLFLEEHARLSVIPSEIYPSSDRWTFFIQHAYHVSVWREVLPTFAWVQ
jgi:hypothetical protein